MQILIFLLVSKNLPLASSKDLLFPLEGLPLSSFLLKGGVLPFRLSEPPVDEPESPAFPTANALAPAAAAATEGAPLMLAALAR